MLDRTAQSWEPKFATAVSECFEQDKRELLALLSDQYGKALQRKATVNWESFIVDMAAWLKEHADGRWRETFAPLVEGVILAQARNWESVLGARFNVVNLGAVAWFEDYLLQFAQPITDTTRQGLTDLLAQAQLEGWSTERTRKAMGLLFRQWSQGDLDPADWEFTQQRLPVYRRELIARTESMRASNHGTYNLLGEWGAPFKSWLATQDDRTRDTHSSAGSRYAEGGDPGPIPWGQPFVVGGHPMRYPLDMSLGAPIGEVANCRCSVYPVMAAE